MLQNQAGFSPEAPETAGPIDDDTVRRWFDDPVAVEHYARAAVSVGLWRSETLVLQAAFRPGQRLLDAGCGAGRIALGLWRLGYCEVLGCDSSPAMVAEAQRLARELGAPIPFHAWDARHMPLEDQVLDGVVFGFNGLMQIPGRTGRRNALQELHRVVRPGGLLVFTTHDRELQTERHHWETEAVRWRAGVHDPALREFGDRILRHPEGNIFMHLPDRREIIEDLALTGWQHTEDYLRSEIANEPPEVRRFSDECRFWVARRR